MPNSYGIETKKNGQFSPVTLIMPDGEEIFLPNTVVDVSLSNDIKSTKIPGRSGNVKELISKDDVSISIQGTFNNREEPFPVTALETLKKIWKSDQAIEIVNPVTDYFLTTDQKVIINNIEVQNLQGTNTSQRYRIVLQSDIISELYV